MLSKTMNSRPLVSVIIIFLNAERFMEEALKSVFAQSYDHWELILVDDGSSDGSTAIARRYAHQHAGKLRYFDHEGHQNRGMSASRNLGIAQAAGEYIAFLDADDVWLPHKLERQVALLEERPDAGMVYGLSQWWYSWTGKPEDGQRDFVHELGAAPNAVVRPPALVAPFFFTQRAAIPNPSNVLIRRLAIEKVGGFENSFAGLYEDQAFLAKMCLTTPVLASNECWDRYRQHPDSIDALARASGKSREARIFFLDWLADYLSAHGVQDREIWRGLRRQRWLYRHPHILRAAERMGQITRQVKTLPFRAAYRILPSPVFHRLRALWRGENSNPPVGSVNLGSLRRTIPFSQEFGYDRGLPIDRYYIEKFLSEHQLEVSGHVLEVADDNYTRRFGGDRVTQSDVLHLMPGDPKATIIADLARGDHFLSNTYDCIILTQTLQFIFDVPAALQTVYRILRLGGVVLATFPGISPISRYDMERWGHFWGFTSLSARRLFEQAFAPDGVQVKVYGNVLAASAFLYGMAAEELKRQELEDLDPDYEVIIAVRAVKGGMPIEAARS